MTLAELYPPGAYECPGAEWELIEVDVLAATGYCQTCGVKFQLQPDGFGEPHYVQVELDVAENKMHFTIVRGSCPA